MFKLWHMVDDQKLHSFPSNISTDTLTCSKTERMQWGNKQKTPKAKSNRCHLEKKIKNYEDVS